MNPYPFDREWTDPWVQGRQENEVQQLATFDGEPPPGFRTRKHCAQTGALLFGGTLLAATCLVAAIGQIGHGYGRAQPDLLTLLKYACSIAPPMAALGLCFGMLNYHTSVRPSPPLEIRGLFWILMIFLCNWIAGLFALEYKRRENILLRGARIGWKAPIFYGIQIVVSACLASFSRNRDEALLAIGFMSPFFAHSVLVNVIAQWNSSGKLLPPPTHTLQFSLGMLLAAVMAIGTYATGLAMLFGKDLFRL